VSLSVAVVFEMVAGCGRSASLLHSNVISRTTPLRVASVMWNHSNSLAPSVTIGRYSLIERLVQSQFGLAVHTAVYFPVDSASLPLFVVPRHTGDIAGYFE
jgi:hypothetical protein